MCVSGPPKCKRGRHLSKMLQEEFINAGLNFIDPEAYRIITEDEEKAEARAIEDASSQRAKDEARIEPQARDLARQRAEEEIRNIAAQAEKIYLEKVCCDPDYLPVIERINKNRASLGDLIEEHYRYTMGIGSLLEPITGNKRSEARYEKETFEICRGLLPDDRLLETVVPRYAEGRTADYCRLIPYADMREKSKHFRKTPRSNIHESSFYTVDPAASAGISRLEALETDILAEIGAKIYLKYKEDRRQYVESEYQRRLVSARYRRSSKTDELTGEILPLVKRLLDSPNDLGEIADHTYGEIKKRDQGADKGIQVDMIRHHVRYEVKPDRIDYYYESNYTNPLSSFKFDDHNFMRLETCVQCAAVALALGQLTADRLRSDPVFELADVWASGSLASIDLAISYPNPAHTRKKRIF